LNYFFSAAKIKVKNNNCLSKKMKLSQ